MEDRFLPKHLPLSDVPYTNLHDGYEWYKQHIDRFLAGIVHTKLGHSYLLFLLQLLIVPQILRFHFLLEHQANLTKVYQFLFQLLLSLLHLG